MEAENIPASPDASQKWVSIREYEKTIDLEHRHAGAAARNRPCAVGDLRQV
jgi:hypothetical protein